MSWFIHRNDMLDTGFFVSVIQLQPGRVNLKAHINYTIFLLRHGVRSPDAEIAKTKIHQVGCGVEVAPVKYQRSL